MKVLDVSGNSTVAHWGSSLKSTLIIFEKKIIHNISEAVFVAKSPYILSYEIGSIETNDKKNSYILANPFQTVPTRENSLSCKSKYNMVNGECTVHL